ncbi:SDR family oxidoreductase [Allokutzneria sp. NRRL B-24872]|uniref:SDR family oxidoreductase n=1 Tax=Allokutzneria sp. NRRL B-24872 TaxID=1137961 RepID=UPI00143D25CB|nr:SDR family NAD(P)-dependent oxidoreductase [Allokutzneria sp. NRRL B-24872]
MIIEAGQVAYVSGAASGIGRALAGALAARGVDLVLVDVQGDALHETAGELEGRVHAEVLDVSDAEAVHGLAERVGRVDLLFNNAGTGNGGMMLWESTDEEWRKTFDVNVFGVMNGIRAFVPKMIEAGRGHVINTSSLAGLSGAPLQSAYGPSKHAVVALSETLLIELRSRGHTGIGVSVVCPGFVNTPMANGIFALLDADPDSEHYRMIRDSLPDQAAMDGLIAGLRASAATMIDADVAAERILTAVERDALHVLPNGDLDDHARNRAQAVLDALDAS